MLFNSIEFAIFLPLVFALYWAVPSHEPRGRNVVLLLASYLFYGWWDWRFLSLILFVSLVNYATGVALAGSGAATRRRLLLGAALTVNLGLLGVFKYYDFFVGSLVEAFTFFGVQLTASRLDLVLPVGISFYTFQAMSYVIDVYRGRIEPARDLLRFLVFVAFFPQLLAGPIERATHMLPQYAEHKRFDYGRAVDGLRQILWGLFKKAVIADNCADVVNATFGDPSAHSASTLLLGAVLYSFQIYGDFSGYSDMAIGTAKLFNLNLMQNFAFPYFSRDIAEFWRRWHMSLTTWFRDYLYIPLGGSRGSRLQSIRNTFIVFLVSGLWHGANWTFIVWGTLHAVFFLPLLLTDRNRRHVNDIPTTIPGLGEAFSIVWTFLLATLAWVFFRADSLGAAVAYLRGILDPSLMSVPQLWSKLLIVELALMLGVEWWNRQHTHGLSFEGRSVPTVVRWGGYIALASLVLFGGGATEQFIYFQF